MCTQTLLARLSEVLAAEAAIDPEDRREDEARRHQERLIATKWQRSGVIPELAPEGHFQTYPTVIGG